MTNILRCDCPHFYQDKIYGYRMRIHNFAKKKELWRCTVCLKEKSGIKIERVSANAK